MSIFRSFLLFVVVCVMTPAALAQEKDGEKTYAPTVPRFEVVPIEDLDVLNPKGIPPRALNEIFATLDTPQEFNCPWWSGSCWCAGGAGSADCNNLAASGKCGDNGIDTGTSADGSGNSGTCSRGSGQTPCSDYYTGAC